MPEITERRYQAQAQLIGGAGGGTRHFVAIRAATIHEAITRALVEFERVFDGGGTMVAFSVEDITDAGARAEKR